MNHKKCVNIINKNTKLVSIRIEPSTTLKFSISDA